MQIGPVNTPIRTNTPQTKKGTPIIQTMTQEQFNKYCSELEKQTKEILAENAKRQEIEQLRTLRENKKMIKAIQDAIQDLVSQGQTVPAKLINLLHNLK